MHLVGNVWAFFDFDAFPDLVQVLHISNEFSQNSSVHQQNAIQVTSEHIYRAKTVLAFEEILNELLYLRLTLLLEDAEVKKHVAVVVLKMLVAKLVGISDDDIL